MGPQAQQEAVRKLMAEGDTRSLEVAQGMIDRSLANDPSEANVMAMLGPGVMSASQSIEATKAAWKSMAQGTRERMTGPALARMENYLGGGPGFFSFASTHAAFNEIKNGIAQQRAQNNARVLQVR